MDKKDKVIINARDIPDAWFQALYELADHGRKYKVQQGSYKGTFRLEFPFCLINIKYPTSEPFIPEFPAALGLPPPTDTEYIYNYFADTLLNPEVPENSLYTYGQRICFPMNSEGTVSQLDLLCERLSLHPDSNQLVLQIASPMDLTIKDPPCLRSIQCRVIDGRLDFHILFRSNDLWNGFIANMGSLALLMKYICLDTGLETGEFIYMGSGLHIYESCFDVAKIRLYRDTI